MLSINSQPLCVRMLYFVMFSLTKPTKNGSFFTHSQWGGHFVTKVNWRVEQHSCDTPKHRFRLIIFHGVIVISNLLSWRQTTFSCLKPLIPHVDMLVQCPALFTVSSTSYTNVLLQHRRHTLVRRNHSPYINIIEKIT